MAERNEDSAGAGCRSHSRRRTILRRVPAGAGLILLAVLVIAWFTREEIADSLIRDQLDRLGLAASYEIEEIGPRRQVLTHVVVGDPARPDLTIERVETSLVPRFPLATIGRIRLVRPRLYGSLRNGRVSFGALDPLIFEQPPDEGFTFPDLDLLLEDGRALIEGDIGALGVKAEGAGNLRDGFTGVIAGVAPRLEYGGCSASGVNLYGTLAIDAERPEFSGPLRIAALACRDAGLAASRLVLRLEGRLDRSLDGLEGVAGVIGGPLELGAYRAEALDASFDFAWREQVLRARYELELERIGTPQLALAALTLAGTAHAREGLSRIEIETDVKGRGMVPGAAAGAVLERAARLAASTPAGPLIAPIRSALAREATGGTLAATMTVRRSGRLASLTVPEARWKGASGASLLALSRFRLLLDGRGRPRFSGHFQTGGPGLPRIAGHLESRAGDGTMQWRLSMAEYRSGEASLALPELAVTRSGAGYSLAGRLVASGPVPGGSVRGLSLPVEGGWSGRGGFALWPRCAAIGFDRLQLGTTGFARRSLRLCPAAAGQPVVTMGETGMALAGRIAGIELAGWMGETPLAVKLDSLALGFPGRSVARGIEVILGAADAPSRLRIGEATLGLTRGLGGTFAGGDVRLAAVPLDVRDAAGGWRLAEGGIVLEGVRLGLQDRAVPGRFSPLVARDARLTLAGGQIRATADLRERRSDRVVTRAEIVHDLASGAGQAELAVDGLLFDRQLQPDTLTPLALGVVANVRGLVSGRGRIGWNPQGISSSGEFRTEDLDFAAAFGPVEGVSGTIVFTDLLGLVTAPEQVLAIRSFNPGIAVDEGYLTYELRPGYRMVIHGGAWPFIGGTLILEPTTTILTRADERRYTLRLIGVDAAQFVQRMDLANISATGRFDGRVPLVFDQQGGRLEKGYLVSRPPGGNLAYVGALTYEDVGAMANFAFSALRSLDFSRMEVELDGPLAGEIVTRVRFDGIRQGRDAKRNIVTRQLARLPIRFNVNIRAPFYRLLTSIKAMYDPAYVRDPRELGLLDARGNPVAGPGAAPPRADRPRGLPADEAAVHSPDSKDAP